MKEPDAESQPDNTRFKARFFIIQAVKKKNVIIEFKPLIVFYDSVIFIIS